MNKKKTFVSWSSGKDSAFTLCKLLQEREYEVAGLFTTVNSRFGRAAMHGVRKDILKKQADMAGLPLFLIEIPDECTHEIYEEKMNAFIVEAKKDNVTHMAFGDLFLEDIRKYREEALQGSGITPLFPLWGINTKDLSKEMLDRGLGTYVTCVDTKKIDKSFSGRHYDESFLRDLPKGIDPCGEKGEFHSLVYKCSAFKDDIKLKKGITVEKDNFVFTDFTIEV